MNNTPQNLLLVVPLSRELPTALMARAALVAAKLELDLTVFCPAVTAASLEPASESPQAHSSGEETLALAEAQAESVARALDGKGIRADAIGALCRSDLDATLETAMSRGAAMVMVSASRYRDWTESLTQGGLLEGFDMPVWIENGGADDGPVLGALEIDGREAQTARLDEDVATQSCRIARALETEVHLLHAIAPESAMQRAAEIIARKEYAESASELEEADETIRAHEIAERWQIPPEHVHLNRAELAQALESTAQAMQPTLVVLGAHAPSLFSGLFSHRLEQGMLARIDADLLIVRHRAHQA